MPGRLERLRNQPLSRKIQYCSFQWARLKTRCLYSWRLRSCGKGAIVLRPLFWTPECVAIGSKVIIWPGCRIEGIPSPAGAGASADGRVR